MSAIVISKENSEVKLGIAYNVLREGAVWIGVVMPSISS